jgi:hypothetical protein
VQPGQQTAGDLRHVLHRVGVAHRAGQHQRDQRLVDQHRVRLVDQHHVRGHRDQVVGRHGQPVAEHVEADLVGRRVAHVRGVGLPPLIRGAALADPADGHAEQVVHRAHPFRVPAGQVVVDRHDVHPVPAADVTGHGQRAGQRLALAGGHLGYLAGQ